MAKISVILFLTTLFALTVKFNFKTSKILLFFCLALPGFLVWLKLHSEEGKNNKKMTVRDFEVQGKSYTNFKLIELYKSKEFSDYQRSIKEKLCMPYEKIVFSDEDE